jgi:hypothetical protein
MPRQALAPAEIVDPAADLPAISAGLDAAAEIRGQVRTLAERLNFGGSLEPAALHEGLRLIFRRTVEDFLEIGVRLALLRAQTPHGEWADTLAHYELSAETARRLMNAAVRSGESPKLGNLAKRAKNVSAALELLAMDDSECDVLLDKGALGNLKLDDIDTMPPAMVRDELRRYRAEEAPRISAMQKVLDDKNKQLDKLAQQLAAAEHGQRALDWGDEANKQLAAITVDAGKALQAMDRLSVAREAILTAKASDGEPVPDSALEAFATTYLDLLEQVWESAGTLLAEGEDLLGGYRDIKRARLNQVALAADAAADADADAPTLQ